MEGEEAVGELVLKYGEELEAEDVAVEVAVLGVMEEDGAEVLAVRVQRVDRDLDDCYGGILELDVGDWEPDRAGRELAEGGD